MDNQALSLYLHDTFKEALRLSDQALFATSFPQLSFVRGRIPADDPFDQVLIRVNIRELHISLGPRLESRVPRLRWDECRGGFASPDHPKSENPNNVSNLEIKTFSLRASTQLAPDVSELRTPAKAFGSLGSDLHLRLWLQSERWERGDDRSPTIRIACARHQLHYISRHASNTATLAAREPSQAHGDEQHAHGPHGLPSLRFGWRTLTRSRSLALVFTVIVASRCN